MKYFEHDRMKIKTRCLNIVLLINIYIKETYSERLLLTTYLSCVWEGINLLQKSLAHKYLHTAMYTVGLHTQGYNITLQGGRGSGTTFPTCPRRKRPPATALFWAKLSYCHELCDGSGELRGKSRKESRLQLWQRRTTSAHTHAPIHTHYTHTTHALHTLHTRTDCT